MTGPAGTPSGSQSGSTGSPGSGGGSTSLGDNPAGYTQPKPTVNSTAAEQLAIRRGAQHHQQQADTHGSGGFEFDPDELRNLKEQWQKLAKKLDGLRGKTRELGQAEPPGHEQASHDQIQAVYDHARICTNIHEQMYQYAYKYAQRLEQAVNELEGADEAAQRSIRTTNA